MVRQIVLTMAAVCLAGCSPHIARGEWLGRGVAEGVDPNLVGGEPDPIRFGRYSSIYEVTALISRVIADTDHCDTSELADPTKRLHAGPGSVYKVIGAGKDKTSEYIIVAFQRVNAPLYPDQTQTQPVRPYVHYKLCMADDKVPRAAVTRTGGLSTGALIVPFKLRDGDLFGDAAVGPYLALSSERLTWLIAIGISNVTKVDGVQGELKNEQSLTYATGLVFQLPDNLELGVIFGADHLSGSAGKSWKYQDEPWISIGFGVNLTSALNR